MFRALHDNESIILGSVYNLYNKITLIEIAGIHIVIDKPPAYDKLAKRRNCIMTNTRIRLLLIITSLIVSISTLWASENDIKDNDFNPVNTGVTTLSIAPDARGSSMGNLGAATDPDMNSQFWNPSKYAFGFSQGGLSLSYTPWLRKIVNDIFLAQLAGYYKLGSGDNQALSASLR